MIKGCQVRHYNLDLLVKDPEVYSRNDIKLIHQGVKWDLAKFMTCYVRSTVVCNITEWRFHFCDGTYFVDNYSYSRLS